ncbi:putative regulator of cell autolysis [Belliella baltica DSM 15883]|uniref:Putative regulator of cell autolysis n=1 Tax=Belliella baltica (strain DSM 15883 / CIP 108006 / LMG 21964 / BA134) TaxID=866536 RepID=I3Z8E9_BELBD|nr:histidine kinase [Belliella baltica]AFL85517.1 putative regulator of cell autolysis [Belliella baltica DSM 15883]
MKDKILPFRQIEWWVVTFLFVSIILSNVLSSPTFSLNYEQGAIYFAKIFIPLIFLATFYLFHIKVFPTYIKDGKTAKFIIYTILIFLGSFISIGAFSVNARFTDDFILPFYFNSLSIYAGYGALTYILNQLLIKKENNLTYAYNVLRSILIYIFVVIFLIQFQRIAGEFVAILFVFIIPSLIGLIFYNFFLIYGMQKQNRKGEATAYLVLLLCIIAGIFITIAIVEQAGEALIAGLILIIAIVAIIFPVSNFFFRKYDNYLGQLDSLTVKVGQGTANMAFLRSQINPHFLFNALNTLYGTALQENGERTAEGIQKLGDMMRFMLHENNQDKIPVIREKEYLVNYVDLQNLRIKEQENIEILFSQSEENCPGEIAPMLLIPFVENAFKHGISFQKKSWIKIGLRCLDGSVHLDVNNSIHRSNDEDPEKKSSGIGLENVKQRLKLLYPDKHELIIRENELEYFVHLSVKL